LSYTVSSLHFTAFTVGILLVGVGGHILIQRIGRWRALWLGAFGMSVSAIILIAGRSALLTIGASFCMGLVGSLILIIIPSILSDWHGGLRAVALSEANVIASLVSTVAPLMVGRTAALPGGWRLALRTVAFAPLLLRLGFGHPAPQQPALRHENAPSAGKPLPRLFWVYWVALVLAVSVEFCMIFWSADYLENSLGMLKEGAAQAVSIFLAAMIVWRLSVSRLVQSFSVHRVIIASILVAGSGFALFWEAGSAMPGLVGLFLADLGVASLYPLLLLLSIGVAKNNTVQAGARATLASGSAILTLPLVLGRLADMIGIRLAYGVVWLLLIGVFVIVLLTCGKVSADQTV
jgi:fucose permease